MKVSDFIECLKSLDQDRQIFIIYDSIVQMYDYPTISVFSKCCEYAESVERHPDKIHYGDYFIDTY